MPAMNHHKRSDLAFAGWVVLILLVAPIGTPAWIIWGVLGVLLVVFSLADYLRDQDLKAEAQQMELAKHVISVNAEIAARKQQTPPT
jgi:hypothetical protein